MHLPLVVEEKSGKLCAFLQRAYFEQILAGVKVGALGLLLGRYANICSPLARADVLFFNDLVIWTLEKYGAHSHRPMRISKVRWCPGAHILDLSH